MDRVVVKQESSAVYDGLGFLDGGSAAAAAAAAAAAESSMAVQQYYAPSLYEVGALGNNGNDSDSSCSSDADRHGTLTTNFRARAPCC